MRSSRNYFFGSIISHSSNIPTWVAHEKNYQLQHTNNHLETMIKIFTQKTNHSSSDCLFTCDNDLTEKESNALHDLEKKSIQIKTTKTFQHMTLQQNPIFQITLCLCINSNLCKCSTSITSRRSTHAMQSSVNNFEACGASNTFSRSGDIKIK